MTVNAMPGTLDEYSPQEAAARADAVVRRLASARRGVEGTSSGRAAATDRRSDSSVPERRPMSRLALALIIGAFAMLFSAWLATLGWPFNPVPHPLALKFKVNATN